MKEYLIDGNNLIGKVPNLQSLQKKDKESARESLVYLVERYFHSRKVKVTIYFDGYRNSGIKTNALNIKYSDSKTADEIIKKDIGLSKSPRNLVVVSSDNEITGFARVCACEVRLSEQFYATAEKENGKSNGNEVKLENEKIDELSKSKSEFVKLFGVDEK
ncbi:MAG: NYN domain-containing protein [Ignavibacteriaceae bacterium]